MQRQKTSISQLIALIAILLGGSCCALNSANAQENSSQQSSADFFAEVEAWPYWTDTEFHGHLKLQFNAKLSRYRVIGAGKEGAQLNTKEECLKLIERRSSGDTEIINNNPAVLLVHGLGRSPGCWSQFKKRLEQSGYTAYEFNYGRVRVPVKQVADHLATAIDSLKMHQKIHLVVHSMGGLVARAYSAKHSHPQLGRVVMLGTPNQGSFIAHRLKDWSLFKLACGEPGQQVISGEQGIHASLPAPSQPFGIIAGSFPATTGLNPLVPGDDDGLVAVESTKLSGAADYLIVENVMHQNLLRDDAVISSTIRFLEAQAFRQDGARDPIN